MPSRVVLLAQGMLSSPSLVGLSGSPNPPPPNDRYWIAGLIVGLIILLLLRFA